MNKIDIVKYFLYKRDKMRENQSLIHLNESFLTLKNVYKNYESSRE
jgi:hypothetical protein